MDVKNLCVFWLLLLLLLKEGLDSSVVAHLHSYCKGNGSNPIQAIFFALSLYLSTGNL